MIYLDNAATTRVDDEVLTAMMPYFTAEYGNAGAIYNFGREASRAVRNSRAQAAALVNARPEQIIFTSGGSEANSLVFSGVKKYLKRLGKTHILVSAAEHDSVLRAAGSLGEEGFEVEYLPVSGECKVSLSTVEKAVRDNTGLVSVMLANNETGAVNPVEEIGKLCAKYGVLFHTDCVQAAGCCPIDAEKINCDFLSISSHKIHGPKGVGALFARDPEKLSPVIYGGLEQEYGIRGGTENVAGIVGFGKACEIVSNNLHNDMAWVSTLKQEFFTVLIAALSEGGNGARLHVNGPPPLSPGKIINIRLDGVDGETLLLMLDAHGICLSAGSACRSHSAEPSHVLTAMGLSNDEARSSVRVSFSKMNTSEEVSLAAKCLAGCADVILAGLSA